MLSNLLAHFQNDLSSALSVIMDNYLVKNLCNIFQSPLSSRGGEEGRGAIISPRDFQITPLHFTLNNLIIFLTCAATLMKMDMDAVFRIESLHQINS